MPPRGLQLRSEQLGLLNKLLHRSITDPQVGRLLEKIENSSDSLNEIQSRNIYLAQKQYNEYTKIPEELMGEYARQQAITVETWKKAKAAKDWKMFEPELEKMVDIATKRYEHLIEPKGVSNVYDAMIDDFEAKMPAAEISKIFAELRDGLVPLVKKCSEASEDLNTDFLRKKIPVKIQEKITANLSELIGYDVTSDKAGGRLDETEHPFTTGYYDDVRVTLHYHEDNLFSAVFAMLHEGGHALYEQNLNPDWKYQPLGLAASYGIHESMSRYVENMIGRSSQFWKYYLPKLNDYTDNAFAGIPENDFIKSINLVRPSKIRIEADEVTYSLHIIIRFEIEQDLFAGKIEISELPHIWNEKYKEYLGVDVEHDAEGVMQDTHWASGYYGYFPSYALGNVYDGMWLEKMNSDIPQWLDDIANGNLMAAIQWLTDNVHCKNNLYDPKDLAEHITGKTITSKPFLEYLENKYSTLFGF
jgi:carboxypeptidase Taq